jgi:hypothetical protein
MRGKLIVAAVAAALIVSVANAAPRAINYVGQGCVYTTYLIPGPEGPAYAQTFKPTFSVLRKVSFVLFQVDPADEDVTFVVNLRNSSGIIATSLGGVLATGTSYEDAVEGEFVTFTFERGARVTPGQSYRLELVRVSGDTDVWACTGPDFYANGYMVVNEDVQAGIDMEFSAKGSGPPK